MNEKTESKNTLDRLYLLVSALFIVLSVVMFYYFSSEPLVVRVIGILLAFGISFQLPLIMYAISLSGLVDAKFWRRNLRYAIIAIIVFGAVITPDGSGVTMWFVSLPMIALYFAGMVVAERQERKTLKT